MSFLALIGERIAAEYSENTKYVVISELIEESIAGERAKRIKWTTDGTARGSHQQFRVLLDASHPRDSLSYSNS